MGTTSTIAGHSSLTEILQAFPKNSERLLLLVSSIMEDPGDLSRGEREAIAAFVSGLNNTGYCVFYHAMFAEVFAGSLEETNQRLTKLLGYARTVCRGTEAEIEASHRAARDAGWSEQALFETVEVCGVFNYINCIVRAANLPEPEGRPASLPQQTDLRGSYKNMAESITN